MGIDAGAFLITSAGSLLQHLTVALAGGSLGVGSENMVVSWKCLPRNASIFNFPIFLLYLVITKSGIYGDCLTPCLIAVLAFWIAPSKGSR